MYREASDKMVECVDCGVALDVDLERGYRGLGEWALCWDCALRRGATFDEQEDRWTVAPDVSGLPPDDEHRVR